MAEIVNPFLREFAVRKGNRLHCPECNCFVKSIPDFTEEIDISDDCDRTAHYDIAAYVECKNCLKLVKLARE